MKHGQPSIQYPNLKGSEQHHDLKNDPGKKGDPDHVEKGDEKRDKNTKSEK